MRRIFLGLIAFVTLVLLYLSGQRDAAPAVGPPSVPPVPTDCPPPTTITLPPETGGATHAAWLQRGAGCDSVHVVEG
ncbi:hypothetical protein [Amycolatopsis echigonensis]|uniref:Alpha/beta hydrolase n=1 Tax=Amycolatopsis echigonensis TaxID=2576905 RepID=A0A2N3WE58_9PSEU|nr:MULTISPECIES: hypothetical protein [Amycolatopsis]MBB2499658.1 hypothetical protein [Amycolatopsis echigonensis]PKV92184.1 hypothetical protein ATK30_2979 [Amycolatopsis niigatensis]